MDSFVSKSVSFFAQTLCRGQRFNFLRRDILRLLAMLQDQLTHARFIRPNRLKQLRAKLKEFERWKLRHVFFDTGPLTHSIVFTVDLKIMIT